MNLSHPHDNSVNSHISHQDATVSYSSFNTALRLIRKKGVGCWMAKSDLESAFKNIPMDFESLTKLGIQFNNQFYIDISLPFGSTSSCAIFEIFATFLEWAIREKPRRDLTHYLDDFFFCESTAVECLAMLVLFQEICQFIQFPISLEKTEGPTQVIS